VDLAEFKGTFNDKIGLNAEAFFDELDRLAVKLGITEGVPLSDAFLKQGRALYAAYLTQYSANIIEVGWNEIVGLFRHGQVPKRKRRVGASTA
jgi:hypothetical protein